MSPIRSLHEGREMSKRAIRFGHVRLGTYNGRHPEQSDAFIFTSADADRLKPLQRDLGGTIERYTPQGAGEEPWRLVSDAEAFTCLFPFADLAQNVSQSFELWRRSGIVRSCEGPGYQCTQIERDEITGEVTETEAPCLCNPERVECSATTRLLLLLPQTGLGAWELVTGSKIAAVHLWDQVRLVEQVAAGAMNRIPIRLVYGARQISYFDEKDAKRKTTTKRVVSLTIAGDAERVLSLVAASPDQALLGAVREVLHPPELGSAPEAPELPSPSAEVSTPPAQGSEAETHASAPDVPEASADEDGPATEEHWSRWRGSKALATRRAKDAEHWPDAEIRDWRDITTSQLEQLIREEIGA